MHAYARVCGPDKGCDGCFCARACACEYVRNDGEGALIWITPRFLAAPPQKKIASEVSASKRPGVLGGGVGGVGEKDTRFPNVDAAATSCNLQRRQYAAPFAKACVGT